MGAKDGFIHFDNMDFFLLLRSELDVMDSNTLYEFTEEVDETCEEVLIEIPHELRLLYTRYRQICLEAAQAEAVADHSLTESDRNEALKKYNRLTAYSELLSQAFWFEARNIADRWDLADGEIELRKGYQLVVLKGEAEGNE